ELTCRFLSARNLRAEFGLEGAPHMADVDAYFFEDGAAHDARPAAALQSVTFRTGPIAFLKALCWFEVFERFTDSGLQVSEVRDSFCRKVACRGRFAFREFTSHFL